MNHEGKSKRLKIYLRKKIFIPSLHTYLYLRTCVHVVQLDSVHDMYICVYVYTHTNIQHTYLGKYYTCGHTCIFLISVLSSGTNIPHKTKILKHTSKFH